MDEAQSYASYLTMSAVVDGDHPAVAARAAELACGCADGQSVARRCFKWMRDGITHSVECRAQEVIWRAREVLIAGHGLCFAEGHLLAALLPGNGIAAGFDYQRIESSAEGYLLHGLNTLWLAEYNWVTVDARGNRLPSTAFGAPPCLIHSAEGMGEVTYGLT